MNATHHDDVGIGRRRLLRQGETVADEVGNVLQVAFGVIVREDDGVFSSHNRRISFFKSMPSGTGSSM